MRRGGEAISLQLDPGLEPVLRRAGLSSFESLMNSEAGEVVVAESGRCVRRLVLPDTSGVAYLKRTRRTPGPRAAASLLRGRWPTSEARRESVATTQRWEAGFPVARLLAWGELRHWGWPCAGFVLTEGIDGPMAGDALSRLDADGRAALCARIGDLLGRLHADGFFDVLRAKDVILAQAGAGDGRWSPSDPVLIDREDAPLRAGRFRARHAVAALALCRDKQLRKGPRLSRRESVAFADAYLDAIRCRWSPTREELASRVERALARLLHRRGS